MSTPFDLGSLDFLVNEMDVARLKIASGEIVNGPLLLAAARSGKPIIISTGICTLDDVDRALGILAFGYANDKGVPEVDTYGGNYEDLKHKVSILHCTSEYPSPFDEVNLKAMGTLAAAFDLPVGLSDHTPGIAIPIAAAARGAQIIEKHFTLDPDAPGPDHRASITPEMLNTMVESIRAVEAAIGDGVKQPTPSELRNRDIARKSLIARQPILAGELYTEENLGVKRPGNGISPMLYWQYLGRRATRDYEIDTLIEQ